MNPITVPAGLFYVLAVLALFGVAVFCGDAWDAFWRWRQERREREWLERIRREERNGR